MASKTVFKIGRSTDLVLAFLPLKKPFTIVLMFLAVLSSTMADAIPLHPDKQAARHRLNIPEHVKCLALLPGSRHSEVEMLSADFLNTAKILQRNIPIYILWCRW